MLGAAAALIGPKDLPIVARTAGRLAGRAIGYVQVARGQFESVVQQSQARQVHKELQDTMAQLEAIRHEIRSVSFMNPGPLTTRLVDNITSPTPDDSVDKAPSKPPQETTILESTSASTISKATASAGLDDSTALNVKSMEEVLNELTDESGKFVVLPISAESAGLLQSKKGDLRGSEILLEVVLEADVAHNAKDFFLQPQIR